jgi:hypothetical protein
MPESELHDFLDTPVYLHDFDEREDGFYDTFGNKVADLQHADEPLWRIAYLNDVVAGEKGEHIMLCGTLDDCIQRGFDARLGTLLFLYANHKYQTATDSLKANLHCIVEPGGKVRPLTSGETWAYLYMIPAMHLLKESLEVLPGARVGLADTHQLWRYGQSYEKHYNEVKTEKIPETVSSSDLTSATDRAEHETSYAMLDGFITDTFRGHGLVAYLRSAARMCCSPKVVTMKINGSSTWKILRKEIPAEGITRTKEGISFTTATGIMMGDPITKCVLTMASMGAYYATTAGYCSIEEVDSIKYIRQGRNTLGRARTMRPFACAGDDHVMVGGYDEVVKPPKFLESMFYEISWPKYRISKRYVHYCQDFGFHPKHKRSIHLDTIKLRLLNQFRKGNARDNWESPNPLPGKAKELERTVECLGDEEKTFCKMAMPFILRAGMPDWFTADLFNKVECFMPTYLGGLGVPSVIDWEGDDENISYARAFLARKYMDLQIRPRRLDVAWRWERGVLFNQFVHNFSSLLIRTRNQREVFEYMSDQLSSSEFSAPVSAKRVMRQVMRDQVNIELPTACLGTKETPYGIIYTGEYQEQKTHKMWPRKEIMNIRAYRDRYDYDIAWLELDLSKGWIPPVGQFVDRKELQAMLGIRFEVPDLSFNIRFFEGGSGRYDLPESLA